MEHRDIEGWLTSKLEDTWSSEKLSPILTKDILQFCLLKFTKIDTLIRMKVLFSFLSLRKKQFTDLDITINMLLQIADEEEDEWLKALAQLLSKVSEEKIPINLDLEPFNSTLKKLSLQLDKNGPPNFFPLETMYLNPKVLVIQVPTTENIHFKLKRPITELPVFSKKSATSFTPTLSASKSSVPTSVTSGSSGSSQNLYQSGSNIETTSPSLRNDKLKLSGSVSVQQPSPLRKSNIFIPRTHHASSLDLSGSSSTLSMSGNHPLNMSSSSLSMSGSHHLSSSSSGLSSEKRGIQKKTKMMTLNLDQVREISNTQTTKKRRQSASEQSPTHPEESPQLQSNLNISAANTGISDQQLHHQQQQQQQQQLQYQPQQLNPQQLHHQQLPQQINPSYQQQHQHQYQPQQLNPQHQSQHQVQHLNQHQIPQQHHPQQFQQHQLYNIEEKIENNGHSVIEHGSIEEHAKKKQKVESSPSLEKPSAQEKKEIKEREKLEKKEAKKREKEEKEREKLEKKEAKKREKEEKKEKKEKEKAEKRKKDEPVDPALKKPKGTRGRKKNDTESTPTINNSPTSSPLITNSSTDLSLQQPTTSIQSQSPLPQLQKQQNGEDLSGLSSLMNALEQNGSLPLEPQYMLQRSNVLPNIPQPNFQQQQQQQFQDQQQPYQIPQTQQQQQQQQQQQSFIKFLI